MCIRDSVCKKAPVQTHRHYKPSGQCPYFVLPNGQVVMLEVIGDIPYLSPGEPRHEPRHRTSKGCPLCGRGRSRLRHPQPAVPSVSSE
eukprot:10375859-Alexandrium_andersonii.AAC.1